MRLLLPALLAALLLLPAASAQPMTFTQPYQIRAALGDIPTTTAPEASGAWNVEQRLAVTFDNAHPATYDLALPIGSSLVNASCSCGPGHVTTQGGGVTFALNGTVPSGSYVLTLSTTQAAPQAIAFSVPGTPSTSNVARVAIVYVPSGFDVQAETAGTSPGMSTNGLARIMVYDQPPANFWAAMYPSTTAGGAAPGDDAGKGFELEWPWALGLGLLLGIAVWAFLVQKGAVQRKGRKQVAATAAHVEAAAAEPPAVLEGRKRALLAALKEVEVARMNNEMPPEVYDAVKADFKKQAVTVMRALETGKQD